MTPHPDPFKEILKMKLPERFTHLTIRDMLAEHPQIGEILKRHQIDCGACDSTSCLFKNVIATHTYDPRRARQVEQEINAYLDNLPR